AFGLGGVAGTKSVDPTAAGPGQSGRMDRILDAGFKQPAGESVLTQSRAQRAGTPAFDAAVADVVSRVSKQTVAQNVHKGRISKDGHSALVDFEIRGEKTKAAEKFDPVVNAVAGVQHAHPGIIIDEFGDASAVKGT